MFFVCSVCMTNMTNTLLIWHHYACRLGTWEHGDGYAQLNHGVKRCHHQARRMRKCDVTVHMQSSYVLPDTNKHFIRNWLNWLSKFDWQLNYKYTKVQTLTHQSSAEKTIYSMWKFFPSICLKTFKRCFWKE